jgi:hypothetical protein
VSKTLTHTARKWLAPGHPVELEVARLKEKDELRFVAKASQILRFWTDVMTDDDTSLKFRLQASKYLADHLGLFQPQRIEVEAHHTTNAVPQISIDERIALLRPAEEVEVGDAG